MAHDWIAVRGARVHNLQNIDVDIPRHRLVVITGLSGSGKSSLAFDTIYAEGQRRYVESLSAYARQFLEQMEKPDVDLIDGLSPAISIEQKTTGSNPRSTVGTVTEIYDYLRLLFASIGVPHCPNCGKEISSQSLERIVDMVMLYPQDARINVLAPIVRGRKGEFKKELTVLRAKGFTKARIDGQFRSLEDDIKLDRRKNHTIEVVVDRVIIRGGVERRLTESVEMALTLAEDIVVINSYRRWGSAVLAAAGVRGLRLEHARDDAAGVLVQLAARRMHRLPGSRRDDRFRSGAAGSGRVEVARRWRDRAVEQGRSKAGTGSASVAQPRFRDRSHDAVQQAAAQAARNPAVRRREGERAEIRGHRAQPAPPLRRGHLGAAGRTGRLPVASSVRDVSRAPFEGAEPVGSREGPDDCRLRRVCRSPRR